MFHRSAKPAAAKHDNTFKLRKVVANNEQLQHLPDAFASILYQFDHSHCHPELLRDIHILLSTSVSLAEALVNDTIPTSTAMQASTSILGILQRIIVFLETSRPGRDAFAVLLPETGTFLPSVFASREEAESQVLALRQFSRNSFVVVPVKVTSQHALQPKAAPPAQYSDLDPDIVIPTLPPPVELSTTTAIAEEQKP